LSRCTNQQLRLVPAPVHASRESLTNGVLVPQIKQMQLRLKLQMCPRSRMRAFDWAGNLESIAHQVSPALPREAAHAH
jgi:hypothetical protein